MTDDDANDEGNERLRKRESRRTQLRRQRSFKEGKPLESCAAQRAQLTRQVTTPEEIERAPNFSRKKPRKMSARNRPRKEERQARPRGGSEPTKQPQKGNKSSRRDKRRELSKQESLSRT